MKTINDSKSNLEVFIRDNKDIIDQNVIADMVSGDDMAFNRIFAKYHDKIYRFVNSLIKIDADVADVVQELFQNLWEKREKIDPYKNFNGFMYRMARNLVLDYFKASKARNLYVIDYTSNFAEYSDYIDSEDIIVAKEVELVIKIAVSQMPEQRRRIFEMHQYEGLSNEEIADILSIKKTTVANQLSLGRKDIEEILLVVLAVLCIH